MRRRITGAGVLVLFVAMAACCTGQEEALPGGRKVVKSDREWQRQLTQPQFYVTRMKGTEPAFSGKYVHNHAKGVYTCVCCGAELFTSKTKFESGTGWPSFYKPAKSGIIDTDIDLRTGERRVEVMCHECGAHLGHVFDDGPPPTGLRYCINSVSLKFLTEAQAKAAAAKAAKSAEATAKDGEKKDSATDDTAKSDSTAADSKKDDSKSDSRSSTSKSAFPKSRKPAPKPPTATTGTVSQTKKS